MKQYLLFILTTLLTLNTTIAQENTCALGNNVGLHTTTKKQNKKAKPTTLTLPFFDDFTNEGPYPDESKWAEQCVYINNHFPRKQISRGVATFDAFDKYGFPYDTVSKYRSVKADTLSTLPIDLSSYPLEDSIYLSFYWQPEGNGFAPSTSDSLLLYFRNVSGVWDLVWSKEGMANQDFEKEWILVNSTDYLYDSFRFRFINIATKGISNSHWHIDYILLDKDIDNTMLQTQDVAFTAQPKSMLNDYYAMPFRHFKANANNYLKGSLSAAIFNNGDEDHNLNCGYTAKEIRTSLVLNNRTQNLQTDAFSTENLEITTFDLGSYNPANINDTVWIENKFYFGSVYPNESIENDTIVHIQEFANYFAYDDGTAESAYYLNMHPSYNIPAYTAVEFDLPLSDTLRGIAIKFTNEVPLPRDKEFNIIVYKNIDYWGGQDEEIYVQDFLLPQFPQTINGMAIYEFDEPINLPAGKFYIGIMQPAGGFSDSLFIGLDVNHTGNNHRFYNTEGTWYASEIDGALLLRPLVGAQLPLTIKEEKSTNNNPPILVFPNPAKDLLSIKHSLNTVQNLSYTILDIQGRQLEKGVIHKNGIDISTLSGGMYLLQIQSSEGLFTEKFFKEK